MNVVPLFNEYRLIERSESEINGAWKGAHLLLFFLAFVFGSFCTFCFHMLMYLFDEKCVLFPKLLSLTSLRHNVIYEFIPNINELDNMPVDFLSTQWVEKSACALPTYVPLVSGIFGLVWTTMFLMCSTGSRTLTGLQRPWRVLPPVFLFSLAMGALCIYSSAVTHSGLQELCIKLGEITGSSTCTYTVNVATLAYERRIRGVYQATRLTILSAWLHTACWLMSALLALVRVFMAIDFQLVRVNAQLHGDIDKILEKHEIQIRTVSPEVWINADYLSEISDTRIPTVQNNYAQMSEPAELTEILHPSDSLYFLQTKREMSGLSLVPEESNRIARLTAYKSVPKDKQFIVKWLYDLVHSLHIPVIHSDVSVISTTSSTTPSDYEDSQAWISRQYGQAEIRSKAKSEMIDSELYEYKIPDKEGKELMDRQNLDIRLENQPTTSKTPAEESVMNLTAEMEHVLLKAQIPTEDDQEKSTKKSNLKTVGVQTDKKKSKQQHVQISETEKEREKIDSKRDSSDESTEPDRKDDVEKETQTRPKEKQD